MISNNEINTQEIIEITNTATREAFKGKVSDQEIENFLESIRGDKVPEPITASGSLYFIGIYGVITCTPQNKPYYFEKSAWGIGAAATKAEGLLFTAYNTWDGLWHNTTGYHAQGIAEGGGILQITFFNKKSIPIGQFNSVAAGFGIFEAGGSGKWKKK